MRLPANTSWFVRARRSIRPVSRLTGDKSVQAITRRIQICIYFAADAQDTPPAATVHGVPFSTASVSFSPLCDPDSRFFRVRPRMRPSFRPSYRHSFFWTTRPFVGRSAVAAVSGSRFRPFPPRCFRVFEPRLTNRGHSAHFRCWLQAPISVASRPLELWRHDHPAYLDRYRWCHATGVVALPFDKLVYLFCFVLIIIHACKFNVVPYIVIYLCVIRFLWWRHSRRTLLSLCSPSLACIRGQPHCRGTRQRIYIQAFTSNYYFTKTVLNF